MSCSRGRSTCSAIVSYRKFSSRGYLLSLVGVVGEMVVGEMVVVGVRRRDGRRRRSRDRREMVVGEMVVVGVPAKLAQFFTPSPP